MQHSILVIDDEKDIVDSIERKFRSQYKIFKASSGYEALKVLQKEDIHLILSDQRMPGMTGVQLFEKAQIVKPDAIRILLTGYTDVESVIAAINNGQIYRYVTKPWDPTELDVILKRALESYDLRAELKEKNTALTLANKELQTLDQAKSHFMILIGHELKTPLTTMNSYLQLLKEEVREESLKKYATRIGQGLDRLNEIVFDVLDLLAAETGQMRVSKKSHSLAPYFEALKNEFAGEIEKKNLKIKLNLKSDKASFDENLMRKVLKKIFHNAVKFSDEDSQIECKFSADGFFEITNHGPKITAEQIEHIIKPFNLDENIMNHSQGMGLGLAVSQSLLKRHGTFLQIESTKEKTSVGFQLG